MKKHGIGSRVLALLLALAMVLPMVPMQANAAKGELSNVSTGLTGDIDTGDTISLPIKIYDYENDGMLFEFAEAYAGVTDDDDNQKTAGDFGSSHYLAIDATGDVGSYWSDVSTEAKSNDYVNYVRVKYAGTTTSNWSGQNSAICIVPSNASSITMNNVRYLTVVYRSNVSSGNFYFGFNRNGGTAGDSGNYTGAIPFTNAGDDGEGSNTNWTYAVYDLKTGSLGSAWSTFSAAPSGLYMGLPLDSSGEWIDLAHFAFFSNKDQATAFGEYALTDGSDRGDNRAFGLLRGSRKQNGDAAFSGIANEIDSVYMMNTYGDTTSIDFSTVTTLGYTLLGTFGDNGIGNVGLLESHLSSEGYPVYKEEVVAYLAGLLENALEISERTSDGWKNYRYVKGSASSVYGNTDLATALRAKINGNTGSYAAASAKDLVGTWAEVGGNIASYYDAAYFLLNSIFYPGSYNEVQDDYDYLVLSAGTDTDTGDKVYVFDGGFTTSATPADAEMAIDYNTDSNTIQNTSAVGKTHFVYEGTNTTTLNPFLPVTDDNTADGMTKTSYYQDDGVINGVKKQTTKDTLYQRDFNFAMVSEGQFTYHADDELFFEFEGDDDVYLFINNELVMDIGSAHSIDSVRFELNDYVNAAKAGTLGSDARNEALALEEGNVYSFKFYYMERHSYGSNIRICTNIRVTDPSMVTAKTAWQDSTQLDFGSVVDKDKVVEYGFAITNNGEENLYNLTFTDNDIGVTLDPTNGLTVKSGYNGVRVFDVNGGTLEATDLTAVVTHPDYDDITVTFADNNALKAFLASLASDAVVENGGGLWIGSTVLIRGIGYKLSDAQIAAGVFDNTVLTTATNSNKTKTLQGQATMRVFVPADPMYYQWANNPLEITKTKLITDVLAAANQKDNILNGKVSNLTTSNVNKIELVTKAGTAITSPYITIDGSYNLTVNYSTTGSHVFYVKVTYNSSKNTVIVPVLVNTTNVADSVIVLDYGLKAELTAENKNKVNELTKNDVLTVPGRDTKTSILGIGSNGAYSPNEITFSSDADGTMDTGSGTYTLSDQSLAYLPEDFMDAAESIQVAMNVYESDATPSKITGTLDINNEVEMYKNVTVLPATVVYYEDDFPAITYLCSEKTTDNENAAVNVFETLGSSSGNSQGVDQDENYGYDNSYAADDEYSGDSLTKVTIKQPGEVAKFTFKGTGFELISRTNAYDSATIELAVYNASGALVKRIPVVTEFDNENNGGTEEIYQVPVIRVDDLNLDTYNVVIEGTPAYDWPEDLSKIDWSKPIEEQVPIIPTILYIDGLRIFKPMGETNPNYTDDENGATFTEVRDLIVGGQAAVATYTGTTVNVSTGTTTWTENRNGEYYDGSVYEGNVVHSVDDYLLYGPNNEVYMDGTFSDTALAFQVTESGTGAHSLQVAIHAVDQGLFYGSNSTDMHAPVYYATAAGTWQLLDTITSGTEMYYTIDYTKCPVENGAYQIILKVDIGDTYATAMASYTTIKTVGLDIGNIGGKGTELAFVNGVLTDTATGAAVDPANYPAFELLGRMLSTSVMAAPEQPEPVCPFVDVQEESFYYDAMLWAVENGITNGTSATTFSPDKLVTRAETVTFLWRAAGEPEPLTVKSPFVDVSESDFYFKAVLWAVENGITNGLDSTHFGPLVNCNRAQVVTFLWRAAGEPFATITENPFADVTEDVFYYDAMLWAVENGITNGIDASNFGPAANCNRAQIVTFLYRAK